MLSAFVWTTAGAVAADTTLSHLTGDVTVTAEPEGEIYTVLTPTGSERVMDVRGVWLSLEVETTALGGLAGPAGGDGLPLGRVWQDLLTAARLSYLPDVSVPAVAVPVVPDLSDRTTLLAVSEGTVAAGTDRLRLKSRQRYAPGDPILVAMALASPYTRLTL